MKKFHVRIMLCAVLSLTFTTGVLSAATMFVTARISPVFLEASTASARLDQQLRRGDQLEQIGQAEGFAMVRLQDGQEGWIPDRFVDARPPDDIAPRNELADLESRTTRRRANSYSTSAAAARGLREENVRSRENVSFSDYDLRAAEWLHGVTRIREGEVLDFAAKHGIGF
ncbi:SH3 domain-containing protein [Spirochaeta dissipatitropha]